jgi:hypothetical protein
LAAMDSSTLIMIFEFLIDAMRKEVLKPIFLLLIIVETDIRTANKNELLSVELEMKISS